MLRSPLLLGALFSVACATAEKAPVTLLYDDSANRQPAKEMYFSANLNPETGEYSGNWNGFRRFPMHDDGRHGDGAAGDHIWGIQILVRVNPMATYEWAADTDSNADNGWIGSGQSFRVTSPEAQTVRFAPVPLEATMTVQEFESVYGVDLGKAGPPKPLKNGAAILFTVNAPDAEQVFLAGSFNGWANNQEGVVTDNRFRMHRGRNNVHYRLLELPVGVVRYKFALEKRNGKFQWIADPHVEGRDRDNNTVLDLRSLMPEKYITSVPGRKLQSPTLVALQRAESGPRIGGVNLLKTWVRPGEQHAIAVTLSGDVNPESQVQVQMYKDFSPAGTLASKTSDDMTTISIPVQQEGPILAEVRLLQGGTILDRERVVLPVVKNISDDLRYGFYANWNRVAKNYGKKSEMLAHLLLNAIEYYDYFPAHGKYAPTEAVYEFEPFFGNKIYAEDIRRKIDSDHERNILAIAYVAAYAASKSIFEKYPFPMKTAEGDTRIFNGGVTTEAAADANGEEKWFWLMAIARDTDWYDYIMAELRRAMDRSPNDLVSFDGFEVDSYGHGEHEKYYSDDSKHSGRLLADVIAEFISDVRDMAHEVKEDAAVSFNCVCEFGVQRMYDITDFIFIENWAGCKAGIEETVDICYRHRAPRNQRVILKMYPPDAGFTEPPIWPEDNLRLMMGMCMTGGGSLMIAGEPDERTGEMHALNTLYYPDNVAIPSAQESIIRDYNMFDAMLYGLNHGRMVDNYETTLYVPGCVVRGFKNHSGDITISLLNIGDMLTWNSPRKEVAPLVNKEIAIEVPDTAAVDSVYFCSPDSSALFAPIKLDFDRKGKHVRTLIPELHTFGAIIVRMKQ